LQEAFRGKVVDEALLRQLYLIFYFMRRLARQIGEPQCHLVIDIDRLSLDNSYRSDIEGRLGELVGTEISFADCRVERYEQNLDWSATQFDALEREVEPLAEVGVDTSSVGLQRGASAAGVNV
jgi:hypothetical protein